MLKLALVVMYLSVLSSPSVPVSMKLDEKDLGRTVEMSVGDTLEVVLRGNPTTGYIWEVASPGNGILKQLGETEFKPEREARGSPGKIIMRFKAAVAGETSLKLIYHRPFERNKTPIKTFEVTVAIK